jgi:hypothetical protein
MSLEGCRLQNLMYNLQLAKRLGFFKFCANILYLHFWRDVNTLFEIYSMLHVCCCTQYRCLEMIDTFFLTHFGQILVQTGAVYALVLLQTIF